MRKLLLVLAVGLVLAPSGHATSGYHWNRPHAELRIIQKQIPSVKPIVDARCTGVAPAKVTALGLRLFRVFDCRVRTNVGGRYPWVAVRITVTGPASFSVVVA